MLPNTSTLSSSINHHRSRWLHKLSSPRSFFISFFLCAGVLLEVWLSFSQMTLANVYQEIDLKKGPGHHHSLDDDIHELEVMRRAATVQSSPRSKLNYQRNVSYTPVQENTKTKIRLESSWYFPRVAVFLEHDDEHRDVARPTLTNNHPRHRTVAPLQENDCIYCQLETDHHVYEYERSFYDECELMADWQSQYFPTCNLVHEAVDLGSYSDDTTLLSTEGSWRTVWRHNHHYHPRGDSSDHQPKETVILKVLRQDRNYTHESFEYHQADIRVMEALTASPYIVSAYSFCGQTVVTEYATGTARDYIKGIKPTLGRVIVARDLARALASIHYLGNNDGDDDENGSQWPTVAHNDINIANAIMVGDQVKLNDFNLAIMMRRNASDPTRPCGSPVRFDRSKWAAPEEIRNSSSVNPAQSDVYSMGNLLFTILTTRQPWTNLEPNGKPTTEEVAAAKLRGQLPYMPLKYTNTTKVGLISLHLIMELCFEYDPNLRITSSELAVMLDAARKLTERKKKLTREQLLRLFDSLREKDAHR